MWGSFSELCGASSLASPRIKETAETCAAVNAVARLFRVRQCLVLVAYVYSAAAVRVERDLAAAVASAQREACHRRIHMSSCFGALGNRFVVLFLDVCVLRTCDVYFRFHGQRGLVCFVACSALTLRSHGGV